MQWLFVPILSITYLFKSWWVVDPDRPHRTLIGERKTDIMKIVLWALLALLTGLLLGGWGPKDDLRKANAEIEQLKKQLHGRKSSTGLNSITSLLRIPENDTADKQARAIKDATRAAKNVNPTAKDASNTAITVSIKTTTTSDDEEQPVTSQKTLQERLQTASDLWKVRADLARNGFVSNVTTSEVQSSQFDLVVADMNLRLANDIRGWVDTIKNLQPTELTPETGIRMMNALSSDLVQTYDQLDATMPTDWRQRAGEKFQVFDLIDPQVAMPLTEIEGLHFQPEHHAAASPAANPQ